MPRKDKYYPNYVRLYPCLRERNDIIEELRRSDRKMKYVEVDLKQERRVVDHKSQTIMFLPSREDSYERLIEENKQVFAIDENLEEQVCKRDEIGRLHVAIQQLNKKDKELIYALYFEGLSEREYLNIKLFTCKFVKKIFNYSKLCYN